MTMIEEGQAAKELLANPLLQESLSTIESAIIEQWQETKDTLVREEMWHTLQGLKRFKLVLEMVVSNGLNELALREKFKNG
jgi:hypothetical protein